METKDTKQKIPKVLIPQRVKYKELIRGFKKKKVNTKETIKQLLKI